MGKLWFEGVPHSEVLFTEDDLNVVLRLLDEKRDRENKNEYSRVFNRIMIQRLKA
jgi:hypothetical protein